MSQKILPVRIEDEMSRSYMDYSMSVIVSRALPDVRDGLKPVHRRIMYSMVENRIYPGTAYKKSARIVGDVMGKYHPHGDSSIYDAVVRMAQDFSMNEILVDGQGNFGSIDGDNAAAMRYTEMRMSKISSHLLNDLDKNTVDFVSNYDGTEHEPSVLPSEFPNLLVNGSTGIAVGMATNIPPHNLGEIIDATCAIIDNENTSDEAILSIIQGPDFPTGGIIFAGNGIRNAILTGRGSITIRAKTHFETINKKQAIIVTEIPYQVQKAKAIEKIGELIKDEKIIGISAISDLSNKDGIRVIIELKRDANPDIVLNQLFAYSQLQVNFGMNMIALSNGIPKQMSVSEVLREFIQFRFEVVTRRTRFLLDKAQKRAMLLLGLLVAVNNIEEIVQLIKSSKDTAEARDKLKNKEWSGEEIFPLLERIDGALYHTYLDLDSSYNSGYRLTDEQVQGILDMRLQKLTGLEKQKIHDEIQELLVAISQFLELLNAKDKMMTLIKNDLIALKEKFYKPRKSAIVLDTADKNIEDLIPSENVVVTITNSGYIKRVPMSEYNVQKRGGKGQKGTSMYDEDFISDTFISNTHDYVMFFTHYGKVYRLRTFQIPEGNRRSKGRAIVNLIKIDTNDSIATTLQVTKESITQDANLVFVTANGMVRRSAISEFSNINASGKIAISLENDKLVRVMYCENDDHIFLATKNANAIRFAVNSLRVVKSRQSSGVRGIKLNGEDKVVSVDILSGVNNENPDIEYYRSLSSDIKKYCVREYQEYLNKLSILEGDNLNEINDNDEVKILQRQDIEKKLRNNIQKQFSLSNEHTDYILSSLPKEQYILCITSRGLGKRTSSFEYRITNRGGSGIRNVSLSKNYVVASFHVSFEDHLLVTTDSGQMIRCPVNSISITGRVASGVKVLNVKSDEKIVSVTKLSNETEIDEE